LGITRSAVLHHFSSKAVLLQEIVRPFLDAVDDVLDQAAAAGPFTAASRRRFVVEMVDLAAHHRSVAALLTGDLSVHAHLGAELQVADRARRFIEITTTANADHPLGGARSLAALGAVLRPLAAPDDVVDFEDPAARALLVASAMAILRTPLPRISPGNAPTRDRGGS
jgi:AcrR family transcriptional regulator